MMDIKRLSKIFKKAGSQRKAKIVKFFTVILYKIHITKYRLNNSPQDVYIQNLCCLKDFIDDSPGKHNAKEEGGAEKYVIKTRY